jgi:ferric-dicitrate binding protein FerR (iron transport regulator)
MVNVMNDFEDIVERYLDGLASPGEERELDRAVSASPAVADAFARRSRFDADLMMHFREWRATHLRERKEVHASLPYRSKRRLPRPIVWVAAAAVGACCLIAWRLLPPLGQELHTVTSGQVLVNGIESRRIPSGSMVEVLGNEPAVIRLADGTRAELIADTKAIIGRDSASAGRVVQLSQGGGEFQFRGHPVHVDTPLGRVSSPATDVFVALRPTREEEPSIGGSIAAALIVGVMSGSVQVQHGDGKYALDPGDNRVYTGGSASIRRPDVAGRLVALSADGKTLNIEVPSAPGKRRQVHLGDGTRLSYVNVPLKGEKPTIGYQSLVWLAAGETDNAASVIFKGSSPPSPRPDLIGRVAAISADGKEVTLEVQGQGGRSAQRTIRLDSKTKTSFALMPFFQEVPRVGQQGTVWLSSGSRDLAVRITFRGATSELPRPDVVGVVDAVAPDGRVLTLKIPAQRLPSPRGRGVGAEGELLLPSPSGRGVGGEGELGTRQDSSASLTIRQIRLAPETKLRYANLDKNKQKPARGLIASIWLKPGATDVAIGVRLAAVVPPKPDPAEQAFFALPSNTSPSADQQKRIAVTIEQLRPRYRDIAKRRDAILSPEQKAAWAVTRRAINDARITDPRLVQEALDAGAGITPDQKASFASLAKGQKALREQFVNQVLDIVRAEPTPSAGQPVGADANR